MFANSESNPPWNSADLLLESTAIGFTEIHGHTDCLRNDCNNT